MNLHTSPMPATFPMKRGICGAITEWHLRRFFRIYFIILATGFALTQWAMQPALQIFGLGVMFPGAGFLAHANIETASGLLHVAYTVLGFGAFVASLALWFATGNVITPPAVYIVLAFIAASMKHGGISIYLPWALLTGICLTILTALLFALLLHIAGMRTRRTKNEHLQRNETVNSLLENAHPEVTIPELSPDDLSRMKFLLDRALQPLNEFNGFEWLDQFQTAAVRYQINFLGYALSMAHARYLPAFQGYISSAQKNLILKQTDHRVWKYWEIENLWGNLSRDPNPAARENIMYTGFCALQMALYQKASGKEYFNEESSFTLPPPKGQTYHYSLPVLLQKMSAEMDASPFHLIACEPNWIYPLCNTIGATALLSAMPHTWQRQSARFRDMLEQEFIDAKGNFVPCRSRYTGLALPDIGGAMPQAMPCFFLNSLFPDIALRQWISLRRNLIKDGTLNTQSFWPIDTGNYGFSRASAYTATALAAAELGDLQIHKLCLEAFEAECPARNNDGATHRPRASVFAHALEFLARAAHKDSLKNLLASPLPKLSDPFIENVDYHKVLVAAAHYHRGKLHAVLYPRESAGKHILHIGGLEPQQNYLCTGAEHDTVMADHAGGAAVNIHVSGRTVFSLSLKTAD